MYIKIISFKFKRSLIFFYYFYFIVYNIIKIYNYFNYFDNDKTD